MLVGTPYLLEGKRATAVMREMDSLIAEVAEMRRRGSLDDGTLSQLREEWKIEQVYETTGIRVPGSHRDRRGP